MKQWYMLYSLLYSHDLELLYWCIPPNKGLATLSFDNFFVVSLNRHFNKEVSCQWFEMLQYSCDMSAMFQPETKALIIFGSISILDGCSGWYCTLGTLQWHHNECDGVSNHQHLDCLLNHLFRHIKENIKALRYWPLWEESTGDRWIPLT